MINTEIVKEITDKITVNIPNTREAWLALMGLEDYFKSSRKITQAIYGTIGNFNFWEKDGEIVWPGVTTSDWWSFIGGRGKPISALNLQDKRLALLKDAKIFVEETGFEELENAITSPAWWNVLTAVYGGDPLRKRETLLWIILNEIGLITPEDITSPNKGCIDYNIMLFFRYVGAITGYEGNKFGILKETQLRLECLNIVEQILAARKDLTIASLDVILFQKGRSIRHQNKRDIWDPYFCYRIGCFYY